MSKVILVTGGAASGKSRWAVTYLNGCDYVLYLCTEKKLNPNTLNRIEYSNKQNMVEWDIIEDVKENPASLFTDHKFVIFDRLPAYTMGMIRRMCPDPADLDDQMEKNIEKQVIKDVTDMMDSISLIDGTMIVITLETGFSPEPDNREQAVFRRILGVVNQRIANMSSEVYLSSSGIQFQIK